MISDQGNGFGNTGFIWIAPIVPTTPTGFTTLDQTASGTLTVKVDRLFSDNTVTAKTSFSGTAVKMVTASSDPGFPNVTGPFYGASWAAGSTVASGDIYRITVQSTVTGARSLGVADVQVVANSTAAGMVDRTKFTPLIVGNTLSIVFRLENKDTDGDTINDWRDNCPVTKNVNQLDSNADGVGNACQCLNAANGAACSTGCKTGESCQSGVCTGGSNVANGTACVSGNLCKQSETCTSGVCGGGSNKTTGTACTTGNPCKQTETCTSGTCGGGSNKTTGTACTTGNPCKQSETCTSGTCGGGSNKTNGTTCSTTNNFCKTGETCTNGTCGGTATNKPNGTACGDGNLCTQTDTCQSGSCLGSSPITCANDACHNTGTCDPSSAICPARKADGTTCSDGNACTQTDTCQAGTCTGGNPVICTAQDQCHVAGTCNTGTGVCSNPNKTDGSGCNDGNACTQTDTCQAGACTGSNPVVCTAQDQCHVVGTCNTGTGVCSNPNKTDGSGCNDGNACTQTDQCQAGACTGSNPKTCTASDQCHVAGTCNPANGTCSNPNAANGTACNDGNLCTQTDTCQGGTCTGGNPKTCTASDQCHVAGTCNAADGTCSNPNAANGTVCNDANACTTNETCQAGVCGGGTAVTCATADQCHTQGACVPATGCPAAANKPNGAPCDDGNACTQGDVCTAGTCAGPTAFTCVSPDTCQDAGTCNPARPAPQPPTQDLIGWWKLDGDAKDATSGHHDLTIEGNVTPAPGRFGLGMKFDGASCMTAPIWDEARMTGAAGMTLMAWINPSDQDVCPNGLASQAVVGRGYDYSLAAWCEPTPGVGVTGTVRAADAPTWGYPGGVGPAPANQWTHVAVTWDHNQLVIYTNGKSYISYPDAGAFGDVDPTFAIGCMISRLFTGNDRIMNFNGAVDEAMLYKRALSASEIAAYYTAADPCAPHPTHPDGSACTDSNLCTQTDTCQAGTCVGTNPVVCTADQCHDVGTCVSYLGTCTGGALKADGTACNDGNICTIGDACQAGVCAGTQSPACTLPPAVTPADINAARQAGLFGYVKPTYFDQPLGDPPYNTISMALAINNAGAVAGYTHGAWADYPIGDPGFPFVADADGERPLPPPWQGPNATAYAVDINESGYIAGEGGPLTYAAGFDFLHPFVYPPGGATYQLPWVSTNPGMQVYSMNNTIGSAGLPELVGNSVSFGWINSSTGTLDVWHFDNDGADAIGPSPFTPPGGVAWVPGHTTAPGHTPVAGDAAVRLDGNECLSTTSVYALGDSLIAGGYQAAAGLTILAWVNPDPASCPGTRTIASRGAEFSIWLDCKPDNSAATLSARSHTTTGDHQTADVGTIPFGQWSHVVVTWDRARARSFVNGALVGDEALGGLVQPTSSLVSVGCSGPDQGSNNFIGAIDEVSMFENGMGADEIALNARDVTNYRGNAQSGQWARIQDGFFNVITAPVGPLYVNSGAALRVNDAGVAVGLQYLTSGLTTAMMYDPARGWQNLNELLPDGSDWDLQVANDIDQTGRFVVGEGIYFGRRLPYRFDLLNRQVTNLGDFATYPYTDPSYIGVTYAPARAINSQGHIVGDIGYINALVDHGFIYTDETGIIDLNDFIDPALGWTLGDTMSINDNDEVVGWARHDANGVFDKLSGFKMKVPTTDPIGTLSCGANDGICLFSDGVVETSPGHFVAVFGYENAATTTVHPAVNEVQLDGHPTNLLLLPPADLSPGTNLGAYQPAFDADHTVSWKVNGETVTATASSPRVEDVIPTLVGIADNSAGVTKAIFTYLNGSGTTINIPYGPFNSLSNGGGFIASPTETPPQTFVTGDHAPFVATLGPNTLTWTIRNRSATASAQSVHLSVSTLPDGTRVVNLPNGTRANLDSTPPDEPVAQPEPAVGDRFYGALSGNLSVSPSGAAIYTVPIAIPPGIAGMAPNLSLVYNSQGGDGIAGQGWELAGLSMIHRCPKTRIQDGLARPVTMTSLEIPNPPTQPPPTAFENTIDGVCIDGKRMFKNDNGTYHLEAEDFSVITQHTDITGSDSPRWFTVETKTGETRYYGLHEKNRVRLCHHVGAGCAVDSESKNEIAIWALDRVVDAWGNYFEIQYNDGLDDDFTTRGLLVTRIDYTKHFYSQSNDGRTQSPTDSFHSITFHYDGGDRWDVRWIRFADAAIPRIKRLTSIVTPLGTYTLNYLSDDDHTLPSRLGSIGYCAAGGSPCLDPLVFDWDGGDYGWQQQPHVGGSVDQAHSYDLPEPIDSTLDCSDSSKPCQLRLPGTQFIDLNGDGRLDFVKSINTSDCPNTQHTLNCGGVLQTSKAWLNNGQGWSNVDDVGVPGLKLPAGLVGGDGKGIGTTFADMDGDGLPDLVTRENKACVACTPQTSGCVDGFKCDNPRKPVVYYNRGNHWEPDTGVLGSPDGTSTFPASWGGVDFVSGRDQLADMDGDGRIDLIRVDAHDVNSDLHILYNQPGGWVESPNTTQVPITPVTLSDVNRDGLADALVPGSGAGVLNMMSGWSRMFAGPANYSSLSGTRFVGDVDGDGFYDSVSMYENITDLPDHVDTGVYLSTGGTGFTTSGIAGSYQFSLVNGLEPPHDEQRRWVNINMADLNGDGLADLIVGTHPQQTTDFGDVVNQIADPGTLRVNLGEDWLTVGATGSVPVVPVEIHTQDIPHANGNFDTSNGGSFIDLNGDGVTDLVHSSGLTGEKGSWLNTFRPPVINNFPNGVARKTQVSYTVITTEEANAQNVYVDNIAVDAGTTHMIAPLRVVSSVQTDDGLGSAAMAMTSYFYQALRGSASGRGPQGFKIVTAKDERSGIDVETFYEQAYPYTGLPAVVRRFTDDGATTISSTATTYCDTTADEGQNPTCSPPSGTLNDTIQTSRFVYPRSVIDKSMPPADDGPAVLTTSTDLEYDAFGNVRTSDVHTLSQTGEEFDKLTHNTYLATTSIPIRLGKLAQSTVTAQQLHPPDGNARSVQHVTEFDYAIIGTYLDEGVAGTNGGGAVNKDVPAMTKKRIEPGASSATEPERQNTELHTAYAYDGFGNVILTKDCASDFGECDPNPQHVGPTELPFRMTTVSYDPAQFVPPSGSGLITSVSNRYGPGRFPVVTTNGLGHHEYSVYDPLTGALRQKTGPNGITTCTTMDPFGQPEAVTARCGSDEPMTTTTIAYLSVINDRPLAKVVTVTRPPTGAVSWAYTDALGRKIATRTRAFDGRFIESATVYDSVGRPATEVKPYFLGDPIFTVDKIYDPLQRIHSITQPLGQIASGGPQASTTLINTYAGLTNSVDEFVGGKIRHRSETKNALGKVSDVTERVYDADPAHPHDVTVRYDYDADANLRSVSQPGGNLIVIGYDTRGRKLTTIDPDAGTWHYTYNAYGDLVTQTDANSQTTVMAYDQLGRMTRKTDAQGTAEWVYDAEPGGIGKLVAMVSAPDDRLSGPCTIPHTTLTDGNRSGRSYKYNKFGDVEEVTDCTDGSFFTTSYEYDSLGRQSRLHYPAVNGKRLAVGYHYTSLGYLHYLSDDSNDYSVLWQAIDTDAFGQITDEEMRNGVETVSTRNPSIGWLRTTTSTAHLDEDKLIQSWGFDYDEAGNLLTRSRADEASPNPSIETFTYDSLNRVRTSQVQILLQGYNHSEPFAYDDLGNIVQKGGKDYGYNAGCVAGAGTANARPAGPHAVCTVTGQSPFAYDGNGNLLVGGGRSIEYNAMNKSTRIQGAAGAVDFIYGADGNRVVQNAGPQGRTVYVGLGATGHGLYERTITPTGGQHVNFIYAGDIHGGNPFALRIVTDDGSTTATKYYSFDHLHSVTALSDELGRVATSGPDADVLGYDPWGARRNPDGTTVADPSSFNLKPGHREFTGHETIPNVGLINMNGRIYDPLLGRFLSPDPTVQFVANVQSYNRYTYVLNNPLRNTDPTGFYLAANEHDQGWDLTLKFLGFGLAIAGAAGCATVPAAGAVGCAVAVGIITAYYNSSVTVYQGASWGQAIAISGVGALVDWAGGKIVKAAGDSLVSMVVTGMASSVANAAFSSVVMGKGLGGRDLLESAATAAAESAFAWGIGPSSNVTSASAEEAQGGGGSGAKRAETVENFLAKEGYRGMGPQGNAALLSAYSSDATSRIGIAFDSGDVFWARVVAGLEVMGGAAASVMDFAAVALVGILCIPSDENINTDPHWAYVVRGGVATPQQLQAGVAEHRDVPGLTGFSVQSAPNVSVDQLAAAGRFKNKQISVTTVRQLSDIGVRMTPSPGQGFHQTVITPMPLPPDLAAKISSVFVPMPNPAPVP